MLPGACWLGACFVVSAVPDQGLPLQPNVMQQCFQGILTGTRRQVRRHPWQGQLRQQQQHQQQPQQPIPIQNCAARSSFVNCSTVMVQYCHSILSFDNII